MFQLMIKTKQKEKKINHEYKLQLFSIETTISHEQTVNLLISAS